MHSFHPCRARAFAARQELEAWAHQFHNAWPFAPVVLSALSGLHLISPSALRVRPAEVQLVVAALAAKARPAESPEVLPLTERLP